jgi:lysophospholipase L1-like esterase
MKAANKLIQDFVKTQDRVQYIDVATPMFYAQDKPPRDLFVEDGLHPTAKCYALWASIIKPVLLQQVVPKKMASGHAAAPTWLGFSVEIAVLSAR